MSKIRTEEQPAPEHTHAAEFQRKIERNAKAAQVHAKAVQHSYETALNVRPDDDGAASEAKAAGVDSTDQPESSNEK